MAKPFRPRLVSDKKKNPELVTAWENIVDHVRKVGVLNYAAALYDAHNYAEKFENTGYKALSQNTVELEGNSVEKRTVDELLIYHGIKRDDEKYDYLPEARTWHAPVQGGKQQMHYLKVRVVPKRQLKLDKERALKSAFSLLAERLSEFESLPKNTVSKTNTSANKLLIPFITDHHIGKLCFDKNGKVTYNVEIAIQRFDKAIKEILSRVDTSQIEQIWFPVGNDLLNTDNFFNTTTKGTQQLTGQEWEHLLVQVEGLIIRAIHRLRAVAPVRVILVRGNHDEHSSFSVVRACYNRFAECEDVHFSGHKTHEHRNYTKFGNNIFMWRHGHKERRLQVKDYATFFMRESNYAINKQTRLFVLEGHLHGFAKKGDLVKLSENETVNGVQIIRGAPLCEHDRYHNDKGYLDQHIQTQALLVNKKGLESIEYFSL